MSRKRFAPLINIGAGLAAVGEGIGELLIGDGETAAYSFLAAGKQFTSGLIPYISENDGINKLGTIINGIYGIEDYTNSILFSTGKSSKSVSYSVFPVISLLQVGTNTAEALIRNKKHKPIEK